MGNFSSIQKQFIGIVITLTFTCSGYSQTCPTFANGTPITNLYTVTFRDGSNTIITSCTCQLSSGTFKCGLCLPTNWASYSYISGGVTRTCINPAVLPVELLYFKANCIENKVKLNWASASERNNQYWTIERSKDFVDIEKIAQIDGAGNSSQLLNYEFEDENTWGESTYYRITQHDYDGQKTVFDWISTYCEGSSKLNVFPNPSHGTFRITTSDLRENPVAYQVIDFRNKIIFAGNADLAPGKPVDVHLEALTPGIYFLRIQSGTESWITKLIKL